MTCKKNIVFMGTPDFAVNTLDLLNKNHQVLLVVTQPDRVNRRGNKVSFSPVKEYALENNLQVFQLEDINSDESLEKLKALDIDYIVVVAYGQIIKKPIRDLAKKRIINVHASLLPKYRGAAPIHRAIMNRDEETGVTIMEVSQGLDKGRMFLKTSTKIEDKNLLQVHDELAQMGAELTIKYIEENEKEEIPGEIQDEEKATYAKKVSRDSGKMDFEDVEVELGKIKGLYPRPGASFSYEGQSVKALDGEIFKKDKDPSFDVGTIIDVKTDGFLVNCANGILKITQVQFPGKRAMTVEDYLKGNKIERNINLR